MSKQEEEKVNNSTDEFYKIDGMTRRQFLRSGMVVASATALIFADNAFRIPDFWGKEKQPPNPEDQLAEIKKRFGIEIPKEGVMTRHQECLGSNGIYFHCGEEKTTKLSEKEVEIITNALNSIPSPGIYTQLIIPFRKNQDDVIGGGEVLGNNWDYFLDPLKYPTGYPKNRFMSDKFAISITLSGENPNTPLPDVSKITNLLPLLTEAALNTVEVESVNKIEYPWTTYGERLKQVIVHEAGGHGVNEYAGRIKVNNNPRANYEALGISIFGGIPFDTNNPITASFAKVNGWNLIPYANYIETWGDKGKIFAEEFRTSNSKFASWPVWDRDPKVWGPTEKRKIRLDTYASYGTINEAFATYFTFFALSKVDKNYDQKLLTNTERQYFNNMFDGLSKNPEDYINKLIEQNPGPSFSSKIYDNSPKDINLPEETHALSPEQLHSLTIVYNNKHGLIAV